MGDHKCFEASSSSKFASKGITLTGKCPASYNTVDKSVVVEQCPDGVTSIRYCSPINVTIDTKGQAMMADALDDAGYTWDSCGTRLDRLKTAKLSVAGSLTAGSKVTVTASGTTDLHVPLETGAWQVRVYEDGEAHSIHSEVGDLMQALKFDDAKNTTFTVTVSFTLPAKQASGKFNANLVATDQSKSDYMCLDVKYAFAAETMAAVEDEFYLHAVDVEDHKCFEASSSSKFASKGITLTGKCPASYNTVDKSVVVEQCPDGVTSIRYCSPINVTIDTKGQAMMAAVEDEFYLHAVDVEDHKCFEASSSSKFASKGITLTGKCPASYNTADK